MTSISLGNGEGGGEGRGRGINNVSAPLEICHDVHDEKA